MGGRIGRTGVGRAPCGCVGDARPIGGLRTAALPGDVTDMDADMARWAGRGPDGTRVPGTCMLGARPCIPGRIGRTPGAGRATGFTGMDMRCAALGWARGPEAGRAGDIDGTFQLVRPVADSTYTCRPAASSLCVSFITRTIARPSRAGAAGGGAAMTSVATRPWSRRPATFCWHGTHLHHTGTRRGPPRWRSLSAAATTHR